MLALRLEFLTGRYVATAYDDRGRGEWPPHPARVFSALVATYHASETPEVTERAALEWLERQAPPSLCASLAYSERDVVPVFVPVNDPSVSTPLDDELAALQEAETAIAGLRRELETVAAQQRRAAESRVAKAEKALAKQRERFDTTVAASIQPGKDSREARATAHAVLPSTRPRQPRTFPVVTPAEPVCHLVWPQAEPTPEQLVALDALAARVTRLGHSSSLVCARFVRESPQPTWEPDDNGTQVLRTVAEGQLRQLEQEYARHRESLPRILPAHPVNYRTCDTTVADAPACGALGDDWLVFERVSGASWPVRRTPDIARALRGLLLTGIDPQASAPEVVTGHTSNGHRTERPHLAFLALPFVGRQHADALIMGVAIAAPRALALPERRFLLQTIGICEEQARQASVDGSPTDDDAPPELKLTLGRAGAMSVRRVLGTPERHALRPATWCGVSQRWATVTPIALDRNPGNMYHRTRPDVASGAVKQAEATIATACEQAGFPRPLAVNVAPVSMIQGAEPVSVYGPFPSQPGRFRRVLVHAELLFAQPVRGPVVLGAGRYVGLGLCRPIHARQATT